MQTSSELAGQPFRTRSITIATAILLFISVYQFLVLIVNSEWLFSGYFLLASGLQVKVLLSPDKKQSATTLLSIVMLWLAIYQTSHVFPAFAWEWLFTTTICTYFIVNLKQANSLNIALWAGIFLLIWQSNKINPALAIWISAASLIVLMNAVLNHIQSLENALMKSNHSDPSTGCSNSEVLRQEMTKSIELCKRYNVITSALALRMENFNDLNQKDSHESINNLINELVQVWDSRLRNTDLLCRLSEEQFICLLPNTSINNALLLSDDLLKASENYEFSNGQKVQLVVSVVENKDLENTQLWLERLQTQ